MFITALLAVVLFRQAAQRSLWDQSRFQAESVAKSSPLKLIPSRLKLWQTRDEALYAELLEPLLEFIAICQRCIISYTLINVDGGDRFVLDTAVVPDEVSHGRELEASELGLLSVDELPEEDQKMRDLMALGQSYSYVGHYIDDYGTFWSPMRPLAPREKVASLGSIMILA